jgi:hypothetical protein
MSLLDSLLGQAGQNVDVAGIAGKLGIDPSIAAQAIAALGAAHSQPGDTVDTAANQTGIDSGTLTQVCQELGGSEGLGQLNQVMQDHPQAESLMNMFTSGEGGGALGGILGMFGKS